MFGSLKPRARSGSNYIYCNGYKWFDLSQQYGQLPGLIGLMYGF